MSDVWTVQRVEVHQLMDFRDEESVALRVGRGGEGGDGRGEDGEEESWKHFVGWVVAFGRECEGWEGGEGGWWR